MTSRLGGLRIIALSCVFVVALGWSGAARAGYGISPNSVTTTSKPTPVVYLDPQELYTATVHVASDNQYGSSYLPVHPLGSCYSFTPTGNQNEYSCQPFSYSSLPPGTYYWWLTFSHADQGSYSSTLRLSGPMQFSVAAPRPPVGAGPVTPVDGTVVSLTPILTAHAPASSEMHFYVSDSSSYLNDGSPSGVILISCDVHTSSDGDYTCTNNDPSVLTPGTTYYWWVVIDVGDTLWRYGAWSFRVAQPAAPGVGTGGGSDPGSGNNGAHTIADAGLLTASAHFGSTSVKQIRLSVASYGITKLAGIPKTLAVACWNATDWRGVSGDDGSDPYYSILGFYRPSMPHWIHLSPTVCHGIETLLYHRPQYPSTILANAVDTVTHEMTHAIGYVDEAQTECYAMQISIVMAYMLGVPRKYSNQLARLTLGSYFLHPPQYVDTVRCREDGTWDLSPSHPSPPWHDYAG